MNGLNNAFYLMMAMIMIVVFAFVMSLGDEIMSSIHASTYQYPMAEAAYNSWVSIQSLFMLLSFNIALPFIIFTSFLSSFINKNQNVLIYVMQTFIILLAIPLLMYMFSGFLTSWMSISLINSDYLQSLYVSNILTILIINMMLSIASFVFVQNPKGGLNVA